MAAISESSDNTGSNEKIYHARPPIDRDITVVAGGDVHWSDGSVDDGIFPGREGGTHMRIPLLRKWIWAPWDPYWPAMPRVVSAIESAPNQDTNFSPPGWKYYLESTKRHGLQFKSEEEEAARHPFARIRETFRSADVAFANLETPISSRGRRQRYMFRSAPAFAEALSWAGIDVVSTANNHAMDAGEEGLSDTLMYLQHAGVEAAGSGSNLAEARRPVILDRAGVRLGFLAYTSFENSGPSGFALSQRSGVAPFDIRLVTEDIHKIRGSVDWVLVSIHWPVENSQSVHSQARALAHAVVDAGADIVLGHHPHVPSGIEVRHGKPIFYSFGNLTFGYPDHRHIWKDNFLARIIFHVHVSRK